MKEYALLINGEYQELRQYAEKPVDIPHKGVYWYEVLRVDGEGFIGLENNKWVIRTPDPLKNPPVPESITPRQCRLALLNMNLLDSVEDMISKEARPIRLAWEYASEFRRSDPLLNKLASDPRMNLSTEAIDAFFIEAAKL